ncbi:MAG: LysR family transcriptional regulator [Erysipelotrichaceae bacterium]|nr:LysR family transcriptional regulator [Erysipelotrichaceae bacterium]MBQ6494282.1 LysR family transcriptional regulator [Erysipelotrichaceae bacterium]
MDIQTMQYYLAVVREGTISAAAQALHVAQPSLSRQMKELEEELGVTLFERGNRRITLTEEGMVLRKRAQEMVALMQLTKEEVSTIRNHISGTVRIGAGESISFHYLSRAAASLAEEYPDIRFHITSGDTQDLIDELNNGLIDFALIFTEVDHTLYQSITLPAQDRFGLLMPKNSPLAEKKEIKYRDLKDLPIIVSRASLPYFSGNENLSSLNIIATYNLIYNASLMVEDGLGYAICFDSLINTTGDSSLCIRPLVPEIKTAGNLIYKKYQVFSPAVQLFIDKIREI